MQSILACTLVLCSLCFTTASTQHTTLTVLHGAISSNHTTIPKTMSETVSSKAPQNTITSSMGTTNNSSPVATENVSLSSISDIPTTTPKTISDKLSDAYQSTSISTVGTTNSPTPVETEKSTKKPATIFSVIAELGGGLSNDSLDYLVHIITDKNDIYHSLLPTVLAIDPRTPILLLEEVLVHPDYSVKILNELHKNPVIARLLLKPVFSNANVTRSVLSHVFSSHDVTMKLLELLPTDPKLMELAFNGLINSIDSVIPLLSKFPHVVHTIVTEVIGNNLLLVDKGLEYLGNHTIPIEKLMPLIMSHPEYITPILKEVLASPFLGNYLFSKLLDNKELIQLIETVLLNSPEMLGTVSNFPIDLLLGEEILGLFLQHPLFANDLVKKIINKPEIVIKIISIVLNKPPLKDSVPVKFITAKVHIITNIVKFILGRNDSGVQLPNSTVPALIMKAVSNTKIGQLLRAVKSGNVPSFKQVLATIQGLTQNIGEIPKILSNFAHVLIDTLEDDCTVDTLQAALGVIHLEKWALKFIDASGKPERGILKGNIVFMGNYDECKEISHLIPGKHSNDGGHLIEGGYCELSVTIPEAIFGQIAGEAKGQEGISHDVRLDLCLPKSCRSQQIDRVLNSTLVKILGIGLSSVNCIEDKSIEGDTGAYVAIVIFVVLLFFCLIGTIYDVYHRINSHEHPVTLYETEKNGHAGPVIALTKFTGSEEDGVVVVQNDDKNGYPPKQSPHSLETATPVSRPASRNRFLMAFSVRENGRKILDASSPRGSLTCLNGIRVLSMTWIILGHVLTSFKSTLENGTDALDMMKTFPFQVMLNAPLAVDTFFLLSGALVCYLFVKEVKKVGRIECKHMILYYVHRYLRLTPLYALVLLLFACLSQYMANGPFDEVHLLERDNCRTYWWRNLLYINTLFDHTEICMRWSWYLSDDMMFYIVSPLAVIPLALGFKVLGFIVIFLMFATHVVTYGYFEWFIGSGELLVNSYQYYEEVYSKPWTRIGVYAIGLALGYFIFKSKCKYHFKKCALVFGWLISAAVAVTVVYITYMEHNKTNPDWPVDARITHETIHRPLWAFCVSWVIFTCVNGQGGFVNTILSWSFWIPLSKLTYGAYLLHLVVLDNIVVSNKRTTDYLNVFHVSFQFIGMVAFAYAFSFIFSLLIEAPSMALEKVLFKRKKAS